MQFAERLSVFAVERRVVVYVSLSVLAFALGQFTVIGQRFALFALLLLVSFLASMSLTAGKRTLPLDWLLVFSAATGFHFRSCSASLLEQPRQLRPFPEVVTHCPVEGGSPLETELVILVGLGFAIVFGTLSNY
jgi:hypothetical protein